MSQFTEAQMVTVRAAVEFLAETQRAHHGHVAADVQEVYDLFNPVFAEEPAEVVAVVEEAPVVEVPADVVEPTDEEVEAHFANEEAPAAE